MLENSLKRIKRAKIKRFSFVNDVTKIKSGIKVCLRFRAH